MIISWAIKVRKKVYQCTICSEAQLSSEQNRKSFQLLTLSSPNPIEQSIIQDLEQRLWQSENRPSLSVKEQESIKQQLAQQKIYYRLTEICFSYTLYDAWVEVCPTNAQTFKKNQLSLRVFDNLYRQKRDDINFLNKIERGEISFTIAKFKRSSDTPLLDISELERAQIKAELKPLIIQEDEYTMLTALQAMPSFFSQWFRQLMKNPPDLTLLCFNLLLLQAHAQGNINRPHRSQNLLANPNNNTDDTALIDYDSEPVSVTNTSTPYLNSSLENSPTRYNGLVIKYPHEPINNKTYIIPKISETKAISHPRNSQSSTTISTENNNQPLLEQSFIKNKNDSLAKVKKHILAYQQVEHELDKVIIDTKSTINNRYFPNPTYSAFAKQITKDKSNIYSYRENIKNQINSNEKTIRLSSQKLRGMKSEKQVSKNNDLNTISKRTTEKNRKLNDLTSELKALDNLIGIEEQLHLKWNSAKQGKDQLAKAHAASKLYDFYKLADPGIRRNKPFIDSEFINDIYSALVNNGFKAIVGSNNPRHPYCFTLLELGRRLSEKDYQQPEKQLAKTIYYFTLSIINDDYQAYIKAKELLTKAHRLNGKLDEYHMDNFNFMKSFIETNSDIFKIMTPISIDGKSISIYHNNRIIKNSNNLELLSKGYALVLHPRETKEFLKYSVEDTLSGNKKLVLFQQMGHEKSYLYISTFLNGKLRFRPITMTMDVTTAHNEVHQETRPMTLDPDDSETMDIIAIINLDTQQLTKPTLRITDNTATNKKIEQKNSENGNDNTTITYTLLGFGAFVLTITLYYLYKIVTPTKADSKPQRRRKLKKTKNNREQNANRQQEDRNQRTTKQRTLPPKDKAAKTKTKDNKLTVSDLIKKCETLINQLTKLRGHESLRFLNEAENIEKQIIEPTFHTSKLVKFCIIARTA